MACIATRLMSSGAAKSGKPCERFTAPYFIASRVISRITDSVNRLALRETRCVTEGAGVVIFVVFRLIGKAADEHGQRPIISLALIGVYPCSSVANLSAPGLST